MRRKRVLNHLLKNNKEKANNFIHIGFEIGLLFKGIDGALEIIGGILLLFLNPSRLSRLTQFLLKHELSEDPKDRVANALLTLSQNFSIDSQYFGIFYLITHGIIKFFIIFLLWRRKLWAYPFAIVTLTLFIFYQIYRFSIDHSIWLILLSLFDLIMIILTYLEYRRMKIHFHTK